MLQKLQKRKEDQQGFTIIEVLIVLAIAALILMIVFLAVPALNRNGRNTSRKADVSALLAAVSEYTNNNGGVTPVSTTPPTYANGTLTFAAPAGLVSSQSKVGYYNKGIGTGVGQVTLSANGTTVAAGTFADAAHDYVQIIPAAECNGTAAVAGSSRGVVAVYEIENGNGTFAQQCQSE